MVDLVVVVALVIVEADVARAGELITPLITLHLQILLLTLNLYNTPKKNQEVVSTPEISSSSDEDCGRVDE